MDRMKVLLTTRFTKQPSLEMFQPEVEELSAALRAEGAMVIGWPDPHRIPAHQKGGSIPPRPWTGQRGWVVGHALPEDVLGPNDLTAEVARQAHVVVTANGDVHLPGAGADRVLNGALLHRHDPESWLRFIDSEVRDRIVVKLMFVGALP